MGKGYAEIEKAFPDFQLKAQDGSESVSPRS
jgi:hypothetical protein